jgi:hypothetical protein
MDGEIKRWTARRKPALVLEIIQRKTTVSESSRQFYRKRPVSTVFHQGVCLRKMFYT